MSQSNPRQSLLNIAASVKYDVDTQLSKQVGTLPAHASQLSNAMEYALLGGGKRIRPLLCCLVGDAVGVERKDSLIIACAIECIHAYSLIHDDLPAMDDDDIRRGKPTCHIAFGEAQAILAGDALQSMAFSILSDPSWLTEHPHLQLALVNTLSKASGYSGMCGGQAIDLAATGSDASIPRNLAMLTQLHKLKTGALLQACVEMPLILSENVSQEHKQQFAQFADCVGLAFQVQDDILDEVGNEEQIGKPKGSDANANKLTFPSLLGIAGAKQQLEDLIEQALQALHALPYNTQLLMAFCDLLVKRNH
jgi:farnesyl diphosphate synthase